MTTERRHRLEIGDLTVDLVRKDIRNLHVGVYPPRGRVRVAAPLRVGDEAVRLAVITRLPWIRRQQASFARQERQSQREMVSGESHYYQGRRYRLRVIEHPDRPSVGLRGNRTMVLQVRPGTSREERELVLQRWYRRRLREQIAPLLEKWEPKVGKVVEEVRIKRMKTRWGSCNAQDRRIWLNLELSKKPAPCLEYLLVHEMVHLHERHHDERFLEWMDRLLPTWRRSREELNRAPLAHEDWEY